jgi:Flp pilus assembly protein protease CpaA
MAKSPVLLVLILFLTFPIWIAAGGVVFGLMMGLIGAIFGVIGAIFGIFFGIIGGAFHLLFGLGSWHGHHFFFNKFVCLALIIVAVLVVNKRSKRVN